MFLLSGVRILAVEQYGSGPFGTSYLTAMGAEVIKIEQPREGGDVTRHLGPYFDENLPETSQSLFFQSLNHGKKSLSLDLNTDEGQQIFHRLAKTADALISNLRGDVPERLGLTYEQMKAHNPTLICGHLTGYGRSGERANWPGYDYLMQAEAGYFSLTGEPDSPPSRMGLSMIDYMTGVVMSLALVSGILKARQTGIGCDVDVSLYDVALHNLNYLAVWHLNAGDMPTRRGRSAHPSLVPCQLYKTADGWIYLMCNKEKFWRSLCDKIERPDLADQPAFCSFKERLANRDELTVVLDDILSTRTTADWMMKFASSVPAAPVHTVEQALSSEFVNQDGRIEEVPTGAKPMRVMRNPIQVSTGNPRTQLSPAMGQDTQTLLSEIGISEAEQAALRERGII